MKNVLRLLVAMLVVVGSIPSAWADVANQDSIFSVCAALLFLGSAV